MPKVNSATNKEFVNLLENAKTVALAKLHALGSNVNKLDSSTMEGLVLSSIMEASAGTKFADKIVRGSLHAFPDIIIDNKYGVEVKMTIGNKWTSTGNSILESTRVEQVEEIYLFFVKIGGRIDVKFRLYQECLNDIAVTHSPRYMIDMDLPNGKSIFDKIGIKYNDLRSKPNPIHHIKDYYRKQLSDGEELWWIDQESTSTPIIKGYGNLSASDQEKFIIESMILFPEIFGNSNLKYSRPSAYLFTEYNAISSNMRDKFTAGGQAIVSIRGKDIKIPKIMLKLVNRSKEISSTIAGMDKDKLAHYWRADKISDPVIEQWKNILDSKSSWKKGKIKTSDLFELGLHV
ncbi:MAG: hypothetical protein ABIH50_01240 [bacterium]